LIDEATASPQQKRRVAVVVCHELAHQWFGNLVTMEWWDDLWLNEGFASWMETYATDKLYPEYKMWTEFAGSQQSRALTLDSLRSSHPVQVPINYAEEVEQVFDAISYSKGATVVQMIHAVLGAENFQAGLQLYMQRHQYGNTTTQDLWRAWEDVSGQPISSIMNNWTKQMGYPLIRVTNIHEDTGEATRAMALGVGVGGVLGGIAGGVMGGMVGAIASGNKSSVVFDVHQEWFLADGTGGGEDKTWMVPLKLGEELQLFSEKSKSLKFQTSGILKLNTGQRVPIRVLYPEQHYSKLISQVRKMPAVDRVGFLSDTFALCKAGYVKGSVLTDLLSQFGEEDNSTVWECLESIIGSLNRVSGGAYQELAKSVVQRAYERYGWESRPRDSFDTQLTRNIVLRMVAKCCWEDKRGEALARYRTEPPMPASYRKVVYQILLKTASDSGDYLALRDLFNEYKNNALKKEVLLSLGSALSPELRKRTLDWATSGQVKMQDFFYPIASVAGSGASGREFVWKYFKDNYARIQKLVETGSPFLMSSVINCSSGGFATMERAKEIEQFFQQNPVPRSSRKIEQIIEGTKNDARFAAWLKQ
jgi:puromycin-sensitive aminopeptidase